MKDEKIVLPDDLCHLAITKAQQEQHDQYEAFLNSFLVS